MSPTTTPPEESLVPPIDPNNPVIVGATPSSEATLAGDVSAANPSKGDITPAERDEDALPTHHVNGLEDQTSYLPTRQVIVVFAAMQLAVILSFLDQTIVSTALPNISAAFNAGRSASWIASSYLMTSSAFQPLFGRLSDVFGRKVTLIACVVIFMIGSLACAVAQTMTQLIVFRGIQGVGGGAILTLVLIIISDVVSLQNRGKYQGITEISIVIANGIGPILGGVLSEKAGWQWCFWINLPVGAVALLVMILFLPLKPVKGDLKQKLKQIDYLGAALSLGGTAMILLPLVWGGTSFAWVSGTVLGCLFGGIAVLTIFFLWEAYGAKIPIVPPSIFKFRTAAAVLFMTALSGATILTQVYYIPQFIQVVRGDSAIRSGVLILPLLIMTTVFVAASGQTVARTGEYKALVCAGYAVWTVGLGLLSTINESTSIAKLVGFLVLTGSAQGLTLQTTMVAAQAAVPRESMSGVTAVRNFLRTMGGSVALAIAAAIINNTLRSQLGGNATLGPLVSAIIDDPTAIWRTNAASTDTTLANLPQAEKALVIAAYVRGFRTLYLVLVGLIGVNSLVSVLFLERLSLVREDEAALKAKGKAWLEERKKGKKGDLERGEHSTSATVVGEGEEKEQKAV